MEKYERPADEEIGQNLYALLARLFPICRSITGNGVRETLAILQERIPLRIHEVPTGTPAFDWTVPKEWTINDGYILDNTGKKVVDVKRNNLHVVGYSIPVDRELSLAELQDHLYSIPTQPTAIPYITSYYEERWGFCLSHNERLNLKEGMYRVHIDSALKNGSLTYGELVIPGASKKEVFLSTYVCHPSLANDNLSGPVVLSALAQWIAQAPRKYTYRIVFVPETIGSLVYLSRHIEEMKKNIEAGFVLTCMGDDLGYSFLPSRNEQTLADRVALNVLGFAQPTFSRYSFLDRGSDERQYGSPGVDLPMVSVMRSKYGTFPEYHTSLDNLDYISPAGLQGGFETLKACLELLEGNEIYEAVCVGEPQLGKRGMYPTISTKKSNGLIRLMGNVLAYADGISDVIAISQKIHVPGGEVLRTMETLLKAGLVKKRAPADVDTRSRS